MTTAHYHEVLLIEVIVVVAQVADGNHALTVVLIYLRVDAVGSEARDMRIVCMAYLVGHKLHHLILYRVALRILRYLLHLAAVLTILLILLLVGRASTLLIPRQQSVNHQVRIAAYGRGEVRIVVESQAVVSDVVYTILRLHHRLECHHLYRILLTRAPGLVHQRIQAAGDGALGAAGLHLIAKLDHKLPQILQLRGVRHVMHAIRQGLGRRLARRARSSWFSYPLGHRTIGQQHKLLNELIGILRHLEVGPYRLAVLIDVEMQLLAVELHRAVLEASRPQLFGQAVEFDQFHGILPPIRMILRGRWSRFASAVYYPVVL